ncbi:MAG TPA: serine protease [Methyloceanibacter sp.]|nr:serine protease [Methyloceanibacter sp.]
MIRVRHCVPLALTLAVLAAWQNDAVAQDPDTDMIVGGEEATDGEFPYQVRIYGVQNDDVGFCGGSVIGDKWVLTAAHCVLDVSEVVVGYGSADRSATTKIPSEKVIVHPAYMEGKAADVALIKLKSQIGEANRIGIADEAAEKALVAPGAKLVVSGWGALWEVKKDQAVMDMLNSLPSGKRMQEEMEFPQKLHWVEIEAIEPQECRSAYQDADSQFKVEDTEICAMQPGKRKDSCYGDSGGPLVVPAADGERPVQVGIVSWGEWCAHETLPGVYARVSSFKGWIDDTIKRN